MTEQRVLVVDDETINLMLIEDFLEQENLGLELYSDPVAAWQRLAEPDSQFSLVVLDRMMPDMDGMEFLRRVRGEARFADIPVIMQTAASAPEQVREGLEAGAYYYLTKPYAPEALISIVRAALEDRRVRAAYASGQRIWKRRRNCCLVRNMVFRHLKKCLALSQCSPNSAQIQIALRPDCPI